MSLELSKFQSTLLEALSSQDKPNVIKATLQQEVLSPALQDYVQSFEPEMVEIAAELVKKWGKRY
ncbi:MAG: hypothetical protein F6K28_44265 [Microcoleus sp. SIO2G3]|nr:hypothetical protein [Microcoleus sp. SIO2G3]